MGNLINNDDFCQAKWNKSTFQHLITTIFRFEHEKNKKENNKKRKKLN